MLVSCSPRTYQFVIVAFLRVFLGSKMAFFFILKSSWSGTWLSYYQQICYQFTFTILQVAEGSIVSYFAGYSYGRHMLMLCFFLFFWGLCWQDFRLNLVWLPVLVRYVDVMMMIRWASWVKMTQDDLRWSKINLKIVFFDILILTLERFNLSSGSISRDLAWFLGVSSAYCIGFYNTRCPFSLKNLKKCCIF